MPAITAAFVGVAHIHTPGFIKMLVAHAEIGDVKVKCVWDHDGERGQKRAAELSAAFVRDVDAILSDPQITAVVICSETNLHRELVIKCANAGKNIFCEKPLGLGKEDTSEMALAIERAGVTFQTGYFQRGSPASQFIKREVQAGHLGKLTRAYFANCHGAVLGGWFDTEWHWIADAKAAGGGALLDLGAHVLDLVVDIFPKTEGEVVGATASFGNRTARYGSEIDEYGTGLLTFETGFSAVIDASWVDGPLRAPTMVFGTEGQISVRDGQVFYQSNHVDGADGKTPVENLPPAAPHAFELFWDALLGKSLPLPLVPVQNCVAASILMERLYQSAGRSTTSGL